MQLKAGILCEPWSENLQQQIEPSGHLAWIYGRVELSVRQPWDARRSAVCIFEDHFIPEIINPATGEVLPYGEEGELVLTTITKEALPVLRYRTRDLTKLTLEPCLCGRTHVRMGKITGRTDDMIIVRGVNVFPTQIESVLEVKRSHYQLIVTRKVV